MSDEMVRILRAHRFILDQTNRNENCVHIDAVELEGPDGAEVWSRALRQEGCEEDGERTVWRRSRFQDYSTHLRGRRNFEEHGKRLVEVVELIQAGHPTWEPGPSKKDREREFK